MPEHQTAPPDELRALLRPDVYRELVEVLEGYARRAKAGRSVPVTIMIGLVLSQHTGRVVAIDGARRVGE